MKVFTNSPPSNGNLGDPPHPEPSFPRILRRIDPILQREDECAPFQWFRDLRRRRPLSTATYWAVALPASVFLPAAGLCLVPNETIQLVALSLATLFLWSLLAPMVAQFFRAPRDDRFPRWLSLVFPGNGWRPTPAQELWLAGLTGRSALTAIYLEGRLRALRVFLPVFAAILTTGVVALALADYSWRYRAITAVLLLALAWQAFGVAFIADGIRIKINLVNDQLRLWRGERFAFLATIRRRLNGVILVLPMLVILGLLLTTGPMRWLAGLLAAILSDLLPHSRLAAEMQAEPLLLVLSLDMILLAVVCRVLRSVLAEALGVGFDDSIKGADLVFDRFMAGQVCRDPDATRIIRRPLYATPVRAPGDPQAHRATLPARS